MRVAAARYAIGMPPDFEAFAAHQRRLLGDAAALGAQVAVLPEYLALELAATFDDSVRGDTLASMAAVQRYREDWRTLFAGLARDTGMHIVAGSFLLDIGGGRYRNRSDVFAPDGGHGWQDKLQLTGFEKATGVIDPGDTLKVFDLGGVRAGISICYDIEFPLPARTQWEAGARLLLVPSCTDTAAGATRVRVGCLARALENRCFVVQSVTAGDAPWTPILDVNTGRAGLFAPMDVGFPSGGVLIETGDADVWAIADLDVDALEAARVDAQVDNDRDWVGQGRPALVRAVLSSFESSR
ncbi:carbon-nitrogen hydrolase family protein [Luteimonas sp. 3794]|uniref:carbon-nitrogen hydrolase family protein n=1 Tax=Luteimonas sp. 3794 TaxID=2817730 RepID=UPI002861B318|nr:carbon-nitrogen hydrolase family protein [Luteimonas sp. 3794]MDR6992838.1 putative amidohydrolase [Luteimonas sp. 3794]